MFHFPDNTRRGIFMWMTVGLQRASPVLGAKIREKSVHVRLLVTRLLTRLWQCVPLAEEKHSLREGYSRLPKTCANEKTEASTSSCVSANRSTAQQALISQECTRTSSTSNLRCVRPHRTHKTHGERGEWSQAPPLGLN